LWGAVAVLGYLAIQNVRLILLPPLQDRLVENKIQIQLRTLPFPKQSKLAQSAQHRQFELSD
jgi:hypothetical protein